MTRAWLGMKVRHPGGGNLAEAGGGALDQYGPTRLKNLN